MKAIKSVAFLCAWLAVASIPQTTFAQEWPAKVVKVIVPFGPGSTPDIVARLVSEELRKKHPGAAFVVENKPGAGGVIGTDAVAKARADGTTIGISIGGPLAISTILMSRMPYDPAKDVAAVTQLVTMPSAIAVHPSLNVNSMAELLALLKREPGKYNFGSIGNGSLSHLAMEAIGIKSKAKMVHVPYPSSPAAVTALVTGDVHMVALPAIAVKPQADAGAAKILAISLPRRSQFLPDVPTLKEAGVDVEADTWMGVIAPGGTSKELVEMINRDVAAAIKSKTVTEALAAQFMEPVGGSPEQFRALIDGEVERWEPIIRAANIEKIN